MKQDSLSFSSSFFFEDSVHLSSENQALPREKTVASVLAQLPRSATEWQKDSAVQANFPHTEMIWEHKGKTNLPLGEEGAIDFRIRPTLKLHKSRALPELPFTIPEVPFRPIGMAGDAVPYRFQNDDFVTGAILLSSFLVIWTIVRSRRFFGLSLKQFFYEARERDNLFASRTESELRGEVFLIFQTCFLHAILFFGYTQVAMPDVFVQVSPYKILGMVLSVCGLYYLFKVFLYRWVNTVFFAPWQVRRWNDTYFLSILAIGTAFFPMTLLFVYFDVPIESLFTPILAVTTGVKLLLLYKAYRIFFVHHWGALHIILYFCTLEILPIILLWFSLTSISSLLITFELRLFFNQ